MVMAAPVVAVVKAVARVQAEPVFRTVVKEGPVGAEAKAAAAVPAAAGAVALPLASITPASRPLYWRSFPIALGLPA